MRVVEAVRRAVLAALQRAVDRVREGGRWKQLTAQPGNRPEYVTGLHSALRHHGIRCVYHVVGTGGGTPAGGIGAVGQTIKLLVHRDDFHRARRIMSQIG